MLRYGRFAKRKRWTAIPAVVLLMSAFCYPLAAQDTTVTGIVNNASGQPVEGAMVRVRNPDSGLTFMVISQAQGRYRTPNLLPGSYTVEAVGGDYQSNRAGPVAVRSGQQAQLDVRLSTARKTNPPRMRKTQAEHAADMPEGPAKELVLTKCVLCHSLDGAVDTRTLRIESSRQHWAEVMGVHKYYMEDLPEALSYEEVDTIIDYMTEHFSRESPRPPRREPGAPPDPNSHLPRTLLSGAQARYVMMEFQLPNGASPHDISIDSEGIAWTMDRGAGLVSRFDPIALSYATFPIPPGRVPSRPSGSAVDPQGIVWNVDNSQNARLIAYNPESGEFRTYPVPAPPRRQEFDGNGLGDGSANMNTLTFHDGFVWGSVLKSEQIYKLDPASGGVVAYPTPKGRPPYGLAFDDDNMLWYGVEFGDEIVKLNTTTGERVHYRVPTPKADLRHIQTDAEGNVWASAQQSDKLIKVDASTGRVTEYEPPTSLSGINSVDVDRQNNLIWVAEAEADKIARFDPRTNTFTEYPLPTLGAGLKRIAVDPGNPNRIWWCANGSDLLGYVEVMD